MIRIYIDSNIFRFLKRGDKELYQNLYVNLKKYDDRLIYYYSHAHLLDLQRDKSEKKYDDLTYMEQFVKFNYLVLPHKEEFVNVQIATPRDAFDGLGEVKSISDIFNIDNLFDSQLITEFPLLGALKENFKELMSMPMPLSLHKNLMNQPKESKELLQKLIPDIKDEYTMGEWIEQFAKIYDNLYNEPQLYKEIRRNSITNLKLFNIDINAINFNEDFKNTPLQQSFLEFVQKSIDLSENKDQKEFNFFTTAYSSLNILGIDKESNKKAKFANTVNDAQHSYYAAHCDYVVSDDEGLLIKSKVLFKLLDIDTKVLHIEEFASQIGSIAGLTDVNMTLSGFLKTLNYDLSKGLIINTKPSWQYDRTYQTIKPIENYFAYFNRFDIINDKQDGVFIVFYRETKNYSTFTSFKELESVTNKIVKIIGKDDNNREFYTENDTQEIRNQDWLGRGWDLLNHRFFLEINKGTKKFSFVVRCPQKNPKK